jgi:hypothetical protein
MKRLGLLALATLGFWLVAALPAGLWLGGPPLPVSLAAAGACLIPSALTLLLMDRLRKRAPEEKVVATLVAPFIRMILSGGGGIWLYWDWPLIREHGFPFITWVVVFYLVTLAVETRLLYIDTTAAATAELSKR